MDMIMCYTINDQLEAAFRFPYWLCFQFHYLYCVGSTFPESYRQLILLVVYLVNLARDTCFFIYI